MKKFLNFLDEWGVLITVILVVFLFFKTCSVGNSVNRNAKYTKQMVVEQLVKDSMLNVRLNSIEHKLDSTLISNDAVVRTNKSTTSAITNRKDQVVVKVVPVESKN